MLLFSSTRVDTGDTPPPLRDDEDSGNVGLQRTRGMQCRDDGVQYTSVEWGSGYLKVDGQQLA